MFVMRKKVLNQNKTYITMIHNGKTIQYGISRKVAHLMRLSQSPVSRNDIVRYCDARPAEAITKDSKKDGEEIYQESIGFVSVLNGLKIKLGQIDEKPNSIIIPKWKNTTPISKVSISSRTRHILSSILTAESDEMKIVRIEDFCKHVLTYPDTKIFAVKEGAIRILLSVRSKTICAEIKAVIGEAFALLGYIDPLPSRGIRILTIDGGGVRGLLVIQMLKRLEQLTGKRVHELFDYICGVSTGAILTCSLAVLQDDLDILENRFKTISTEIFTQSTLKGTSSLVWSHSYYDTDRWEQLLRSHIGEDTLLSTARNSKIPKMATVSAVVNQERVNAYVFRNYSFPWRMQSQYLGGSDRKVWEAARASAAAPTYFGECKLGNLLHQDGGILVNNPTALAIHEAKLLWPGSSIQCVVSFGTGRIVPISTSDTAHQEPVTTSSWKNKFMKILDSATDTEGVHTMLSDLLPENVYFRFNPYLTEMIAMSEIDPIKLEQLERDAIMYLRRNDDKFQMAAKVLLEKRQITQKAVDYINLKIETYGLISRP